MSQRLHRHSPVPCDNIGQSYSGVPDRRPYPPISIALAVKCGRIFARGRPILSHLLGLHDSRTGEQLLERELSTSTVLTFPPEMELLQPRPAIPLSEQRCERHTNTEKLYRH
jgi:hypothetical protein